MIISAESAKSAFLEAAKIMDTLPTDLQLSVELNFEAFGTKIESWDYLHLNATIVRKQAIIMDKRKFEI